MADNNFIDSPVDEWDRRHKPEDLTCYKCEWREECPYVDDWYNTDGDCLAMK